MLRELPQKENATPSKTGRCVTGFSLERFFETEASVLDLVGDVPHQTVVWPEAAQKGIRLDVRRDDLIHPLLSGNKLYKLFGYLRHWFAQQPQAHLCSFGGAFSNHLHALAAFGKLAGVNTLGVIRGERPPKLSPTLRDLIDMGMQLVFVERSRYRLRQDPQFREALARSQGLSGKAYWIPEGGEGELGRVGCEQLGRYLASLNYDVIALACGTGTSYLGLYQGLSSASQSGSELIGISALRNSFEVLKKMPDAQSHTNWTITNEFHFGGFAKSTPELDNFMRRFESVTAVPVETVYTGKLFYGLSRFMVRGCIPEGSRVLAIHSGGLQGKRQLGSVR